MCLHTCPTAAPSACASKQLGPSAGKLPLQDTPLLSSSCASAAHAQPLCPHVQAKEEKHAEGPIRQTLSLIKEATWMVNAAAASDDDRARFRELQVSQKSS